MREYESIIVTSASTSSGNNDDDGMLINNDFDRGNNFGSEAGEGSNKGEYNKFNASPETVLGVVLNLRRNVSYFYNTFWVLEFTLVSALILCPKQPWWSAAFAHIIAWCMMTPQPSAQVSSSHHDHE
jgi:hypothetical protein